MRQGSDVRPTPRTILAVGLALLGLAFLGLALLTVTNASGWGYDFEAYFWAAQRVARGDSAYLGYTLEGPFSPGFWGIYMYAPPLAALLMPFTILSQDSATILWFVLRVGLLAFACGVMPVRPTVRLLTFAVAAFSPPVLVDMVLGNVSVVVVCLLAVTWRWLDRPIGSVAAAVAMSVRPTLGVLLIWWAVRRRWSALVWAGIGGVVLILVTLPFAPGGWLEYERYLTVLRNVVPAAVVNQNRDLATTLLRFGIVQEVATLALVGGYALAIGASIVSLRFDREVSFMVTVSGTLLLAPLLWDHYLASLLLPAAFLAQRGRPWGLALPLLAWLPPAFTPLVAIAGTLAPFLAARLPAAAPDDAAPDDGAAAQASVGRADVPGPAPGAVAP